MWVGKQEINFLKMLFYSYLRSKYTQRLEITKYFFANNFHGTRRIKISFKLKTTFINHRFNATGSEASLSLLSVFKVVTQ